MNFFFMIVMILLTIHYCIFQIFIFLDIETNAIFLRYFSFPPKDLKCFCVYLFICSVKLCYFSLFSQSLKDKCIFALGKPLLLFDVIQFLTIFFNRHYSLKFLIKKFLFSEIFSSVFLNWFRFFT